MNASDVLLANKLNGLSNEQIGNYFRKHIRSFEEFYVFYLHFEPIGSRLHDYFTKVHTCTVNALDNKAF